MGYSGWCFSDLVCSQQCGERLHSKIQSGMILKTNDFQERAALQMRINNKYLRHLVKSIGRKPKFKNL